MSENATIADAAPADSGAVDRERDAGKSWPASMPSGGTVLALWLPTPARRRLIDADLEIVEDISEGPALILASTRGPAARRVSIRQMSETAPVVVVCHPGGEQTAAEMIAMGAVMIVAEGLETSAVRVLDGDESDHMLEAYLSELDRSWSGGSSSVDSITGLASVSGFEIRLVELSKDGGIPRLGLIDLGFGGIDRSLGTAGEAGLKRRLATLIDCVVRPVGGETFDLGETLGVLAPGMGSDEATRLGHMIVEIAASFTPSGDPLDTAVGWAGPESAADPISLRLLAERALQVASGRESRVVDAEELSEHAAASIELAAAFSVADLVDGHDPRGDHSVRVSDYAADLARELQLEPAEVAAVGLAGRLHDVGKAHWGDDAFDPESEGYERCEAEHPATGERMVKASAGSAVASMIRGHHERWDGTGRPDGIAGNNIPIGTRVLAVAHMYDELAASGTSMSDIEHLLREAGGATVDPDLVEAAIALFVRG